MVIKMAKATFKYKLYGRGYDSGMIYLFYEYRGREYEVYINNGRGGGDSLSVQHKREQSRIDYEIEHENDKPKVPDYDVWDATKEFFDYVG